MFVNKLAVCKYRITSISGKYAIEKINMYVK